jgi:hypothetical protein
LASSAKVFGVSGRRFPAALAGSAEKSLEQPGVLLATL